MQGLLLAQVGHEVDSAIGRNIDRVGESAAWWGGLLQNGVLVILALLALAIGLIVLAAIRGLIIRKVAQNERGVIERWGKFHRYVQPGIAFLLPFRDSLRTVSLEVSAINVKERVRTGGDQPVFAELTLVAHLQLQGGAEAIAQRGAEEDSEDLKKAVLNAIYGTDDVPARVKELAASHLRSDAAGRPLDEIFTAKDTIAEHVGTELSKPVNQFGHMVVRTLVTDVDPGKEITTSSNAVVAAGRAREAALITAKTQRDVAVEQATGTRDSDKLIGEGQQLRVEASISGVQKAIRMLTNDQEMALDAAGAVAVMYGLERLRVLGMFAQHGGASAIMIPDGAGIDSKEIMSVVAAVLGADSTGMAEGSADPAELERKFDERIERALADGKQEIADHLKVLRGEVAGHIRAAGEKAAQRVRKIPMVGKKAARALSAGAEAAANEAQS